jgi:ribonuclease P protein component
MIKKKFKLKGEDIKKFFLNNFKKINYREITIYYQKNNLNYPRFAVFVSPKVFKKAVLRNKIKRRIYAIINELLKENRIKPCDFFIVIKDKKDFQEFKNILINLFSNIK